MSRAFVNEDAASEPDPIYTLPPVESEHFDVAAAHALIEGADAGNTRSAEAATGYRWGEPRLGNEIEVILRSAEEEDDERTVQLARRFLRRRAEIIRADESSGA